MSVETSAYRTVTWRGDDGQMKSVVTPDGVEMFYGSMGAPPVIPPDEWLEFTATIAKAIEEVRES